MSDWLRTPLAGVVGKVGSGATPKGGSSTYGNVGTPFIRSMNIVFFGFKRDGLVYLTDEQAKALNSAEVLAGDVLLNITGASIGRVTLAPRDMDGARVNQHVCIIRPNCALNPRYLSAYLSSPEMQERIWADNYGVTRQALTKQQILDFEIPLPPLEEQKRIANKLDSVLARVEACRERLDRIPALLKRFRQSILVEATSGRLTVELRAGHCAEQAGRGPEAAEPASSAGLSLSDPVGWTFERAESVCAKVQSGGTPKEGFSDAGVPFLKVYNLVDQKVAFDYKPQYIAPELHCGSMSKSRVLPGDVLMNIVGPPLGKVAVVPHTHAEWNINQAITLFRPSNRITTEWLYYILCGGGNIAEIVHETKGSAGQVNISLSQCRDFVFPVPPLCEQNEIVRRVETLFAFADRIEARYAAARRQVGQLNPALLAKAFRGELVPQDPADEPAAELLKRLGASRSEAPKARRGRKAAA